MSEKNKPPELYSGKLTGIHCPWCDTGEQVIRQNRETKEYFLSCTKWPSCKFSSNLPEATRMRAIGQIGLFDD